MANDHLRIMCPNLSCRLVLAVPSSARGKTVRCKGCSTNIRIPQAAPVKTVQPEEKKDKGAA